MWNWIKTLRYVVKHYTADLALQRAQLRSLETVIKERTDIAVEVGYYGDNYVIVVGRFKGRDYIQTHRVQSTDLANLIEQLRAMEKFGTVRRVDAPPIIRGVFRDHFSPL